MTPLPFVWPYAAPFWIIYWWVFWPEFGVIRRSRHRGNTTDARSLQVIMLGMWVALMAAFPLAFIPSLQVHTHRVGVFVAGTVLLFCGSLLRRHCFRMLGSSFTGDVRARSDQEVITRGAYGFVRHPSYTAGIMMNTGIGLALGSLASAGLLLIASCAVYIYRMSVEERALLGTIGEPYARFMRTRKRLIPFVY